MMLREYFDKEGELREEIKFHGTVEMKSWWDMSIRNVMENTREVLDNLEYLPEFKVNWANYHNGKYTKKTKSI